MNKLTKNNSALEVNNAVLQDLETRLILSPEKVRLLNVTYEASAHFEGILGKKKEQKEHHSKFTTATKSIYFVFQRPTSAFHKSQYFSAQCQNKTTISTFHQYSVLFSASSFQVLLALVFMKFDTVAHTPHIQASLEAR